MGGFARAPEDRPTPPEVVSTDDCKIGRQQRLIPNSHLDALSDPPHSTTGESTLPPS